MSLYESLSLFASILTSAQIFLMVNTFPSVLVRPSFMAIIFLHLTNQWSSALHAGSIESTLPNHWDYFLLTQLFPPIALATATLFFRESSEKVLKAVQDSANRTDVLRTPIRLLFFVGAIIMLWYFSQVPFRKTGLYAIFFDPDHSTMARELSMKLLKSQLLRYAHFLLSSVLAPLLAVFLAMRIKTYWSRRAFASLFFNIVLFVLILFCVSIYGARSPSAMILLTAFFALWLQKFKRLRLLPVLGLISLLLIIPALLTLLREGQPLTFAIFGKYFLNVVDRVFGRAILDGLWHMKHVAEHGFWGLGGIGNVGRILGYDPVNIYNKIALLYMPNAVFSASANTTFLISYYVCFGMGAFFVCLGLLCLLDALTIFYLRLHSSLVLPCVACCQIAAINLASTFFTTVLLTFGLAIIPMCCWLLTQRIYIKCTAS